MLMFGSDAIVALADRVTRNRRPVDHQCAVLCRIYDVRFTEAPSE
jgi:hypothetical protein